MSLPILIGHSLEFLVRDVALGGTVALCSTACPGEQPAPPAGWFMKEAPSCACPSPAMSGIAAVTGLEEMPEPQFGQAYDDQTLHDDQTLSAEIPGGNEGGRQEPRGAQEAGDTASGGASVAAESDGIFPAQAAEGDPAEQMRDQPKISLSRGGLTISGGYSSIEGPNAQVQLVRSNFPRTGQGVTAVVSYSQVRSLAMASWASDGLRPRKLEFASSIFASSQRSVGFTDRFSSSPFEERSIGGNIRLQKPIAPRLSLSTNLRLSRDDFRLTSKKASCDPAISGGVICAELGRRTMAVVTVGLTFDRRDNPVHPSRGFRLRASEDIGGLGTAGRYLRSQAGFDAYFDYGEEWNIAVSAEGGVISALGSRAAPLFQHFYIGGQSLRGFDLRGISPRIKPSSAAVTEKTAIGGKAYYTARIELAGRVGGIAGQERFPAQPVCRCRLGFRRGQRQAAARRTAIRQFGCPPVFGGSGAALADPDWHDTHRCGGASEQAEGRQDAVLLHLDRFRSAMIGGHASDSAQLIAGSGQFSRPALIAVP